MRLMMRLVTTVDASEIGLQPGVWPKTVTHEGFTWTSPEFTRIGGNLLHVEYHCNGRKLVVVND